MSYLFWMQREVRLWMIVMLSYCISKSKERGPASLKALVGLRKLMVFRFPNVLMHIMTTFIILTNEKINTRHEKSIQADGFQGR